MPDLTMNLDIVLIRHAEVESVWKSICYGAMDVPLSEHGARASVELAQRIAAGPMPTKIFHSGLRRTEYLAEAIAACLGNTAAVVSDARLRERNYGDWQGSTWDDAYASDPEHFHHLIERPDTYRPPGGETTTEMQSRIVDWFDEIRTSEPTVPAETIIAISHSGPIAALAGHSLRLPATRWQPWMLGYLESIRFRGSRDPVAVDVIRQH